MSKDTRKPEATLSDGAIKASIWKRDSAKGAFYATSFSKTYRDNEGQYQSSQNFSGTELLKVSELAKQAYQESRELYYKNRQNEHDSRPKSHDHDRER